MSEPSWPPLHVLGAWRTATSGSILLREAIAYDSELTLAYAEPSDIDVCNAALMILESADTAKHGMLSASRDFQREAITYGHTEANSHEVDIPTRDPSPKKEWGETHPSRTTKLATMPKPCSWCGTEANLERCTERCRRELCQECLPTTKHHPCSVWANMVWENAVGDTELRETHSIEAAPGGAKELSKEALEMSTTTYTCATRDISEPDHMSEPVQVTSVGALKHAIDSTHARKPEESPSKEEWRAADRKSVDIIARAGGSYFGMSVDQKKIKIAKPTEKGAHKSRKAIDGAWRPLGNPSCSPTTVGTDSSSSLVIDTERGATKSELNLRRQQKNWNMTVDSITPMQKFEQYKPSQEYQVFGLGDNGKTVFALSHDSRAGENVEE